MTNPDRDHERVLEHAAWVQRLAFRLCADAALAEDVTQESLLSAFCEPTRRGPALRHWLVGVVRNRVRMAKRSASRRSSREAQTTPPPDVASPDELVERADNHRIVVEAVTALPEIYRTALLRRYFDDLSPTQIAALEGVPEATIKTRLRRGLELLRERLADDFGDREPKGSPAWLVALVPMARLELRRRGAATGAATAGTPLGVWAIVAAAAGVCCWAGIAWWDSSATVSPAASPVAHEMRAQTDDERRGPFAERAQRTDIEDGMTAGTTAGPRLAVQAQVCNTAGRPIAGVELIVRSFDRAEYERRVGQTGTEGTETFDLAPRLLELRARSSEWVTVVPGTIFPYAPSTVVRVVVARSRSVRGFVTDEHGVPIGDARVTYSADALISTQLDVPIDRASRRRWSTTSDASGAFDFDVPELPGARLHAEAWDYESSSQEIHPRGNLVETCTLAPRNADSSWLQGHVRRTSGEPAAGAVVALGAQASRCDSDGRFRIDLTSESDAGTLQVVAHDLAPKTIVRPATGWPTELEVELSREPLTIEGFVRDAEGHPRAGVEVDIADHCGRAFLPRARSGNFYAVPLEQLCLGARTASITDEHGRFMIGGLAARSYRLVVRDRGTLAIEVTDAIASGSANVALDLRTPRDRVSVAGRVVDDAGQPLRGAPVTALVTRDDGTSVHTSCRTDASGAFAFERSIRRDAMLRVAAGGDYTAVDLELSRIDTPDALRIIVQRAGSFFLQRMDGRGPEVDGFRLESLTGDPVRLQRVEGRMCFTIDGNAIESGRSSVVRAPVGVHQLVLLHRGREVRRRTVGVLAGPTVRIDF